MVNRGLAIYNGDHRCYYRWAAEGSGQDHGQAGGGIAGGVSGGFIHADHGAADRRPQGDHRASRGDKHARVLRGVRCEDRHCLGKYRGPRVQQILSLGVETRNAPATMSQFDSFEYDRPRKTRETTIRTKCPFWGIHVGHAYPFNRPRITTLRLSRQASSSGPSERS